MREIIIKENEAGQRLDKFLHKYMPEAGSGFLFKMMRKKNITLNGTKCEGKEKLAQGDCVKLFLAEETIDKFRGAAAGSAEQTEEAMQAETAEYREAYRKIGSLPVVYEDRHVLFVNKPAGLLTQKAERKDISLNEWLIGYLLSTGALKASELQTFRPSVCNRLDRNTSGLVLCGKSLAGSQLLSRLLKERSMHKFYRLFVAGKMEEEGIQEGYLTKDARKNQVKISRTDESGEGQYIKTGYRPLKFYGDCTYVEVELFTGKTHQIRAHLASLGHPLIGDTKYGSEAVNRKFAGLGIRSQMLHAFRVEFPALETPFESLSRGIFKAEEPENFRKLRERDGRTTKGN